MPGQPPNGKVPKRYTPSSCHPFPFLSFLAILSLFSIGEKKGFLIGCPLNTLFGWCFLFNCYLVSAYHTFYNIYLSLSLTHTFNCSVFIYPSGVKMNTLGSVILLCTLFFSLCFCATNVKNIDYTDPKIQMIGRYADRGTGFVYAWYFIF